MNFKVRIRNKWFWATICPAGLGFIYTVLGCFDITPAISESAAVQIVSTILTGLAAFGVLIDPTTKGIKDSTRAMNYDKPYTDK